MRFAMRLLELERGGHTPWHHHDYEHEVFVLEGVGEVVDEHQERHVLQPGTVVLVLPNELHQFVNTGAGLLRFLCLIPQRASG